MPAEVNTCPKCGALITAQLARCRRCGHYLHGTSVEGFFFDQLLPESLRHAPGTGAMSLFLVLYFILMVVLAGPNSAFDFSSYSLTQLGANAAHLIYQGEYWRFVTSMFGHADAFHLAFNLYALAVVGPLAEEAFDRKKMIFIFILAGVVGAVASFFYGAILKGYPFHLSIGASGGVCGLQGAVWIGARRMGPAGREVAQRIGAWMLYILGFGLLWPGIDNAAHLGGMLVGVGLGRLAPLGITQTVAAQRGLSLVLVGIAGVSLFSGFLMIQQLRGYPVVLADDWEPKTLLGLTLQPGADRDYSSQKFALDECRHQSDTGAATAAQACEQARRIAPYFPGPYRRLVLLYRARGEPARAAQLQHYLELFFGTDPRAALDPDVF